VPRYVALLRGINVGTAKRVAMADLKALSVELGFENVATVLNSGNLLFDAKAKDPVKLAVSLRLAIVKKCEVDCAVMVVSAETLKRAIAENPLTAATEHPSRFLIAFARDTEAISQAKQMTELEWQPDQLVVGRDAIYLWCDEGVLDSPLNKAFAKKMGDRVTARNWTTLQKVCAIL
jgi:uncharacterized protein (DUF1697 family)